MMTSQPLVAVDVGNARIKLGRFRDDGTALLPQPAQTLRLAGGAAEFAPLAEWLGPLAAEQARLATDGRR